jgi:hypothetical protein
MAEGCAHVFIFVQVVKRMFQDVVFCAGLYWDLALIEVNAVCCNVWFVHVITHIVYVPSFPVVMSALSAMPIERRVPAACPPAPAMLPILTAHCVPTIDPKVCCIVDCRNAIGFHFKDVMMCIVCDVPTHAISYDPFRWLFLRRITNLLGHG